jgi:flagellar biosynthesis regulator FlaF
MKLIASPLVPLVSAPTISGRITLRIINEVRNIFRKQLRHKILRRLPVYTAVSNHPEIHMLICKRDFEMAIITAAMLNLLGKTAHSFTFHDDGTMDDQMEKIIYQQFPGTLVVRRNVADLIASQKLSAYPKLLEFRKKHVMALKLIDVALWAQEDRIGYLDSDILFFRYPKEFIRAFEKDIDVNYFNRDIANAYITDCSSIKNLVGLRPASLINAGLWVMNKKDIDLNLIESWLKHSVMSKYKSDYRLEQTFAALLAQTSDAGVAHFSSGYNVSFEKKPEKSIAKHYVGRIRYGYELEGIRYLFSSGVI